MHWLQSSKVVGTDTHNMYAIVRVSMHDTDSCFDNSVGTDTRNMYAIVRVSMHDTDRYFDNSRTGNR